MNANLNASYIVYAIIGLIVSLVIHEFMHAYAGHLLGDTTAHDEGRLTLNPLKHIDPFMTIALPIITLIAFGAPVLAAKPVPFNPDRVKYGEFGAAMIAAAGPLANLVLAFLAALIGAHSGISGSLGDFLNVFITLNVSLFVFNSIPIPPLDGSRVLYAFAPEPIQEIMHNIEPVGIFIVFGLVFIGNLGGLLVHLNQIVLNLLP